jgi:hypothetical protein
MRGFSGAVLVSVALALTAAAGWKWHSAALMEPDRMQGWGTPTLVLVLQEGDCPDRRAGLARWLEEIGTEEGRAGDAAEGPRLALAFLRGDPESVEPGLRGVEPVDPGQARNAARALGRAGVTGTPGFVLVDEEGRVLLAEEIDEYGPGRRLDLAVRAAGHLLPRAPASRPVPPVDLDAGSE